MKHSWTNDPGWVQSLGPLKTLQRADGSCVHRLLYWVSLRAVSLGRVLTWCIKDFQAREWSIGIAGVGKLKECGGVIQSAVCC
jgi:hypothetical protein